MTLNFNNTLLYVLARNDSSLTRSTFANGVLYVIDSLIFTICLVIDGGLLRRIKMIAVVGCVFNNTTMAKLVISSVVN